MTNESNEMLRKFDISAKCSPEITGFEISDTFCKYPISKETEQAHTNMKDFVVKNTEFLLMKDSLVHHSDFMRRDLG